MIETRERERRSLSGKKTVFNLSGFCYTVTGRKWPDRPEMEEGGIAMTPTVTIIIPVYNAEASIHRCVDSVLSQEYTDFELLLVDDGSTDHSGEICDE